MGASRLLDTATNAHGRSRGKDQTQAEDGQGWVMSQPLHKGFILPPAPDQEDVPLSLSKLTAGPARLGNVPCI